MRRGVKNTLRVWTESSLCSQATVGCSREWKLTGSRRLDRLRPFDIPLSSASRSDLPHSTDWTDRARNVPVGHASNSQTCANCQWSGDRSIIQSLFFSPPKPRAKGRTCRPLQSHYQWNPCLDKWRETNVLLWRKVLSQRVRVAAKSPKWRDKISW